MSRITNAGTAYDTDEIVALRQEMNDACAAFKDQQREFRQRKKDLCARYSELMRAQRPTYPTADHIEGIARIATWVHNDIPYGDHLGGPTENDRATGLSLPRGVRYSSASQRINFFALAPYEPGAARYLWSFTDDDVAALRELIEEHLLRIVSEWRHGDGRAFVVASRQV